MGLSRKRKVMYIFAIVLSVLYLLWRVLFTIPWHTHIGVLIFALALVISEIVSNLTAYVLIILRLMEDRHRQTITIPEYDLSQPLPDVDILIVTHNEDVALLKKTVNAATFIDYPDKARVHIVLCDDGNRPEVARLARQYHVDYIGMTGNKKAKSGNINHALAQLHAPLFAIFDADMIPFSGFLADTVPLFVDNLRQQSVDSNTQPLGFVQTPQSFYNADIFQFNLFSEKIVANEQDFFSRDVNVLNGYNKIALFTGSNAMFLRQAVKEVGWFPTDTLTEDFELGAKINIAGYASLATANPQSSGITPVDIKGVVKQRTRWARGVIQSCRNIHIFTNPRIPFLNRIVLINTYLYWWSFLRRLIYIAAPILYALFKFQVVYANFWILMIVWAPGYFLLHVVLGDASSKIRNERWGEVQETFFAPYLFLPVLLQTLRIKAKKFKVTNKNSKATKRDLLYILPYLLMWLTTLVAIIKFNYGKWGSEIIVGSVITFWLLMHFINLSFCLFISMGRTIYRQNERFVRKFNGEISIDGQAQSIPIRTNDISETGLSFVTVDPRIELAVQTHFTGVLWHRDQTKVQFSGTIVRQTKDREQTNLGAVVTTTSFKDRNYFLHLVYDGESGMLPKEQDSWITPFDELNMNFTLRLKQLQRKLSIFTTRN